MLARFQKNWVFLNPPIPPLQLSFSSPLCYATQLISLNCLGNARVAMHITLQYTFLHCRLDSNRKDCKVYLVILGITRKFAFLRMQTYMLWLILLFLTFFLSFFFFAQLSGFIFEYSIKRFIKNFCLIMIDRIKPANQLTEVNYLIWWIIYWELRVSM